LKEKEQKDFTFVEKRSWPEMAGFVLPFSKEKQAKELRLS